MGFINKLSSSVIIFTKSNIFKSTSSKFTKNFIRNLSYPNTQYKLVEVGVIKPIKTEGIYEIGQIFLHRLFGYRGVILFPWCANVYDRSDIPPNLTKSSDKDKKSKMPERKAKSQTYYQVLIDNRDLPYIKSQNEAIAYLGNQDNKNSLYAIPGLDYVSNDDIMPYISTEKVPIQHELFEKFLMPDPESNVGFTARETLKAWQERNHPLLDVSDAYTETTQNIRVTVIPFYMGSRSSSSQSSYWWRYSIRIENLGKDPVILRERHWRIFSLSGTLETVRGKGVVGREPCLNREYPAFQYSSHVSLQATSGHMWGTFKMEKEDGNFFEVRIPPFNLESKEDDNSPSLN